MKKKYKPSHVIAAILVYVALTAISWLGTCGIVKLITLCFGWNYTWALPTGIYLIFVLIRFLFGRNNK